MKKYAALLLIMASAIFSCRKNEPAIPASGNAGGLPAHSVIVGNELYIAVTNRQLTTYDISTPAHPVLKNNQPLRMDADNGLFANSHALFINGQPGLNIYNILQPASPREINLVNPLRGCSQDVVVNDSMAFAYLQSVPGLGCDTVTRGLYVFDIAELPLFREISFIPVQTDIQGPLCLKDTTLFIGDVGMLLLLNVRNPYHPVLTDTLYAPNGFYQDLVCDHNLLICGVGTGILLYDIADIHSIRFLGEMKY